MPRVWKFAPFDQEEVRRLSTDLKVSFVLAQILAARGYSRPQDARTFLDARLLELREPDLLTGVDQAAERIKSACQAGRRVTIYGDYDVDGVSGTSILWQCLKLLGANVDYYVPHRLEEGYGLNCDALRHLHEEDPQRVIVTVDCGISSVKEAALCQQLGLELIITDHHQPGEQLPQAAALVHPGLPGREYPFRGLCGAAVAFKLAWRLAQIFGDGKKATPRMRQFLVSAVGLAAIGTVADCVPLIDENRLLVRYGLKAIQENQGPGLRALLQVCELSAKQELQAEDIGFGIAPRINAAGRLGQARLAVELLTTDSPERAAALAEYIDQQNKLRQSIERKILKQAREMFEEMPDRSAIVLANSEWHGGVIGIVASRMVEMYDRPAVLISLNNETAIGTGSGRSFGQYDLYSGFKASSSHLIGFGGHHAAAGLKIEAGKIEAFREDLCAHVTNCYQATPKDYELRIDAEVRLTDLTHRAVRELDRMGPFGQANPRPILSTARVDLVEPSKKIGNGERHLAMTVRQENKVHRVVCWGRADWVEEINDVKGPLSISFAPSISEYRGFQQIDLRLLDWKPAG